MRNSLSEKKEITPAKKIIFSIAAIASFFVVFNFLCGFIAGNTHIDLDPVSKDEMGNVPGYFHPLQDRTIVFPGLKPYKVSIDRNGFRNVGVDSKEYFQAHPNAKKILAIGDSVTFGLFSDDEDTYPYQLQKLFIEQDQKAVVYNAGIGATTITDHLYYLKTKGLALKPDWVILNFCNNDLGEMMDRKKPFYQRMHEEMRLSFLDKVKRLSFMRMGRKIELKMRYDRKLRKKDDEREKMILKTQSTSVEDNLYMDIKEGGIMVSDPFAKELEPLWQEYFQYLTEFHEILKENDIKFVYVIQPTLVSVWNEEQKNYQDIIIQYLERANIAYVDLRKQLQPRKEDFLQFYVHAPRDFHLGLAANQILAREIFDQIQFDD